jgi:hypothetical protein
MWLVEAEGETCVFTYLVDAPEDATPMAVACCAYAQHGILYREEKVPELLGPIHIARWMAVVAYDEETTDAVA